MVSRGRYSGRGVKRQNCAATFAAASAWLAFFCLAPFGTAAQTARPDPELQPYVTPGLLADIGGRRKIHVLCMGHGSPTVILSAGSGNWSET